MRRLPPSEGEKPTTSVAGRKTGNPKRTGIYEARDHPSFQLMFILCNGGFSVSGAHTVRGHL